MPQGRVYPSIRDHSLLKGLSCFSGLLLILLHMNSLIPGRYGKSYQFFQPLFDSTPKGEWKPKWGQFCGPDPEDRAAVEQPTDPTSRLSSYPLSLHPPWLPTAQRPSLRPGARRVLPVAPARLLVSLLFSPSLTSHSRSDQGPAFPGGRSISRGAVLPHTLPALAFF